MSSRAFLKHLKQVGKWLVKLLQYKQNKQLSYSSNPIDSLLTYITVGKTFFCNSFSTDGAGESRYCIGRDMLKNSNDLR